MDSRIRLPIGHLPDNQQKRIYLLVIRQDFTRMMELIAVQETVELLSDIIVAENALIADGGAHPEEGYEVRDAVCDALEICEKAAGGEIKESIEAFKQAIYSFEEYPMKSNRGWTEVEISNLIQGMRKYLKGHWKEISLEYLDGYYRTIEQCKDKYRNLEDAIDKKRPTRKLAKNAVSESLLTLFDEARKLTVPVTVAELKPPELHRTEFVEKFLRENGLEDELVSEVLWFMNLKGVEDFLIKARTHRAALLMSDALIMLLEGKLTKNLELEEDFHAVNALISRLSKQKGLMRVELLDAGADMGYSALVNPAVDGNIGGNEDLEVQGGT